MDVYVTDCGEVRNWRPVHPVRMTKAGRPDLRYSGAKNVMLQMEAEAAFMSRVMRSIDHTELRALMRA